MTRPLLPILLALLAPIATATTATWGDGVELRDGNTSLFIQTGSGVTADLTFTNGAPTLDGITLDIDTPTTTAWTLTSWPNPIVLHGAPTQGGTLRVLGLAHAVAISSPLMPEHRAPATDTSYVPIPAGEQTITIQALDTAPSSSSGVTTKTVWPATTSKTDTGMPFPPLFVALLALSALLAILVLAPSHSKRPRP